MQFLQEEGCDEVQGYLLGRPAAIGTFRHYTHGESGFGNNMNSPRRVAGA
jgi:EAL domain-containing protein (putative c-di-GMP-specific phosphodiesterase class I)